MARIHVEHFTDPGCPWAYSASPALTVLRWRFGDQLDWRHRMIGLSETAEAYLRRGYTTVGRARGWTRYRDRFGMPFAATPKARVTATSPACRAIVAVRLAAPEREWAALRALQLAQFATSWLLDEPEDLRAALRELAGVELGDIEDPRVLEAYEADRGAARTAAGSPTEAMGRSAATDGPVRYTAPSLLFSAPDGRSLDAGGFQHVDSYDMALANLDPALERRPAPLSVGELLGEFPDGLTTMEVAAALAGHLEPWDRAQAELALIDAVAEGAARRKPLGDDALWTPA